MSKIILIVPFVDKEAYRRIQVNEKISNPGQKFYELLYQGLVSNNVNVKIYSMVDKKLQKYLSSTEDIFYQLYKPESLLSKVKAYKSIAKQIKTNEEGKVTIIADAEAFWTLKAALKSKLYLNSKIVAIVTDFPHNVYSYSSKRNKKDFLDKLKEVYARQKLKTFRKPDGFILLTKHMKEVVAGTKPWIVIEGFSDCALNASSPSNSKSNYKNIVYLGALNGKSGILNLIRAFMNIKNENIRLDIYGTGIFIDKIIEYSHKDTRINYCGVVSLDEIVKIEQEAHFLINPRPSNQEFNKYSFPSKTIEYMSSGTPVITTKLEGIPNEYNDFLYFIDDSNIDTLTKDSIKIIDENEKHLFEKGERAKEFVLRNKNNIIQGKRILDFIHNDVFPHAI